ncbi:MAG: pyrroline-5-carboxylate reductase [Myxococcota bacterium]
MSEEPREPIQREVVLVGCGKMGSALVSGLVESGELPAENLVCNDANPAMASALADRLGARVGQGGEEATHIWIFAVKPRDIRAAIDERRERISDDDLVISVAAGVNTTVLRGALGSGPALVRTMPNTPALVRHGVTGVFSPDGRGLDDARRIFAAVGEVVELSDEAYFDALTAISGSGPAYIFTALEALADGGVLMGLSRDVARKLAVSTVRGAAALVENSPNTHTAELKDRVASPAGTTIAALAELEQKGFRDALISAVRAAAERSRDMGEDDDE